VFIERNTFSAKIRYYEVYQAYILLTEHAYSPFIQTEMQKCAR